MLVQLISRARYRLLFNAMAAEGVRAATVALALLIALLLLGTDILNWRWLIALPAAALATGAYLAIRRLPGPYLTAQIVDARLRLADALSTALFFSGPERGRRWDAGMRRAQCERAAQAAERARAADAVPFRTPRLLYAMAPLALVACTLFVLRYTWQDRLDLRQPMPVVADYLLRLSRTELAKLLEQKQPQAQPSAAERDSADDDAEGAAAGKRTAPAPPDDLSQPEKREDRSGQSAAESPTAEGQANGQPRDQSSDSRQGRTSPGEEQQQDAAGQQAQQSDSSSGLVAKLSDAVRNMLSRLTPQSNGSRSRQEGASSNLNRQGGRQEQRRSGQSGSQQSAGQSGSSQGAASREGQQARYAMGTGNNSDGSEKQPGSSAGSEDGAKDVKEAAQLAAMGKISVILGKRSENVTGNVSVETISGEQSLVTPYTDTRAAHIQTDAQIDRDEVPVMLQEYVQRYFAAVRSRTPKGVLLPGK